MAHVRLFTSPYKICYNPVTQSTALMWHFAMKAILMAYIRRYELIP